MNNVLISLKQVIVLQQKYAAVSKLLYPKAWLMLGCISLEENLWMFVVARVQNHANTLQHVAGNNYRTFLPATGFG